MCIKNLETFEPHRGLIGHSGVGLIKGAMFVWFGGNLTTCEQYITAALSMKQPSTLAPTFNKAGSVPTVFLSPDDDPNELKVEKRIVLVAH